jgi:SAM-dependent methyltransferase
MTQRRVTDGGAGDVDYGVIGGGYTRYRRPDPRIAALLQRELGDARRVLNVGAGAGSYEPIDRDVTAVEPSASMRAQRPSHLAPAVDAMAEHLPFASGSFDASMTTFSVHQWRDAAAGLAEMRRVTHGPVVVMTCDPDRLARFWLDEYAPEVITTEARRYPGIKALTTALGTRVDVIPVPIPLDCVDGFNEAYYGRPEFLLSPRARQACSAWSFMQAEMVTRFEHNLRRDLDSGAWDARHGHLRAQPTFEGALILVVGRA